MTNLEKEIAINAIVPKGNTSPLAHDVKSLKWFLTLNNYNDEEYIAIKNYVFSKKCKYFLAKEIGEKSKIPHIHAYFRMLNNNTLRFSTLKRLFPRARIEKARGDDNDQWEYLKKDNNFITNIDKPIELMGGELSKKWQFELKDILLNSKLNFRNIYWYWDNKGNVGKSTFIRHMIMNHETGLINKGKYSDMINQVYNYDNVPKILLIDIPRNMKQISYSALEDIKNGVIANSKYETGSKIFNPPHIVVFCNFEPDTDIFSEDRLIVKCLDMIE